jgi:putative ATP-binding cassette transporter
MFYGTVGGALAIAPFGCRFEIPGYLVIAALIYSPIVSAPVMISDRRLTPVIGEKNQAEAEFRSVAAGLREHADTSALRRGSKITRSDIHAALDQVPLLARVGWDLTRITLASHANPLFLPVLGLITAMPKYPSGATTLGEITQSAAFLSWCRQPNWLGDNFNAWRTELLRSIGCPPCSCP